MKRHLKPIALGLVIVLLIAATPSIGLATCNDVVAAEKSGISNAKTYTIGMTATGTISDKGQSKQYYKFTLPESGMIHITGSANVNWAYLYIYDSKAEEVWKKHLNWNSTLELIPIDEKVYLTSGTYYFCIGQDEGSGNYDFRMDFTSSNESFSETEGGSNNSLQTASQIECNGTKYFAQLAQNDEKDFWKFTLNESGHINFQATFKEVDWIYITIYDEKGLELADENPHKNDTTNSIVIDKDYYLTSGTYYICVSHDSSSCYGAYEFEASFTSANETYHEVNGGSNNSIQTASDLVIGSEYRGSIDLNDEKDFFGFEVSKGTYTVKLNADAANWLYIKLFDHNGNEMWSDHPYWNNATKQITYTKLTSLDSGKYYIVVDRDSVGDYKLSIDKLTQANCPHEEYESKWHDATYFSKGYREYTCKDCGYTYKSDYTDKEKLSQVELNSYYRKKKNAISFSWYSVYDASGYQIRYSRNKSMRTGVTKKNTKSTSITIKKLASRKKYYVQVRAYVKSGKKIAYGPWSVLAMGTSK